MTTFVYAEPKARVRPMAVHCGHTQPSTDDGYEWRCMTDPHPLRPDEHYYVAAPARTS